MKLMLFCDDAFGIRNLMLPSYLQTLKMMKFSSLVTMILSFSLMNPTFLSYSSELSRMKILKMNYSQFVNVFTVNLVMTNKPRN